MPSPGAGRARHPAAQRSALPDRGCRDGRGCRWPQGVLGHLQGGRQFAQGVDGVVVQAVQEGDRPSGGEGAGATRSGRCRSSRDATPAPQQPGRRGPLPRRPPAARPSQRSTAYQGDAAQPADGTTRHHSEAAVTAAGQLVVGRRPRRTGASGPHSHRGTGARPAPAPGRPRQPARRRRRLFARRLHSSRTLADADADHTWAERLLSHRHPGPVRSEQARQASEEARTGGRAGQAGGRHSRRDVPAHRASAGARPRCAGSHPGPARFQARPARSRRERHHRPRRRHHDRPRPACHGSRRQRSTPLQAPAVPVDAGPGPDRDLSVSQVGGGLRLRPRHPARPTSSARSSRGSYRTSLRSIRTPRPRLPRPSCWTRRSAMPHACPAVGDRKTIAAGAPISGFGIEPTQRPLLRARHRRAPLRHRLDRLDQRQAPGSGRSASCS